MKPFFETHLGQLILWKTRFPYVPQQFSSAHFLLFISLTSVHRQKDGLMIG